MKALILSSLSEESGCGAEEAALTSRTEKELRVSGWDVTALHLGEIEIAACRGCFLCWVKTPGVCVMSDPGRTMPELWIQSDLVLLLTPVSFGGYSYHLKKAIDRLIPILSPFFAKINCEVHHKPRYDRYPSVIAIGLMSNDDEAEAALFRTIVERNAINWHCKSHAAVVLDRGAQKPELLKVIHEVLEHKEAA